MSLSCGLFRRRRTSKPEKPRRVRTISIFDSNLGALKRMIKNATIIVSPVKLDVSQSVMRDDPITREMHDVLTQLYIELRRGDPELSNQEFTRFLKEVQGEPSVNLEKVTYGPGDFLFVLKTHRWDAVALPLSKDCSKPITNYFINSSHNTYLVGNQLASKSSPEAYKNVLLGGGRCIEIDVWNGDALMPTPRSKSPAGNHHARAISGSYLPYAAAAVIDTVEDTYETAKDAARSYLGSSNPNSHSRSPSPHGRAKEGHVSPNPTTSLIPDPHESSDLPDVSHPAHHRARHPIPRGEPIVTHGWTLTTPCGFREVCQTVREFAFVNSDLPVIVSLEVHADLNQQEDMVRIMKEEWQDMLVQHPQEGCDPKFRVPKLEDLRNKILVKVKRAQAKMGAPHNTSTAPAILVADEDASCSDDERSTAALRETASYPHASPAPRDANIKVPMCQSLSDLAVYTRSERFKGLDTPQAKLPTHIFSISENKILGLHERHPREVFTHNKSFFMRAFPAGRRIDSSNPNLSLFWRKGVQMVAMNWQNMDDGMMLNEGMFAGENGWVLKPAAYQGSDKTALTLEHVASQTLDLDITVFAGRNIPPQNDEDADTTRSSRSTIRPLIKAELHVGEAEKVSGQTHECAYKQRTKAAKTANLQFGPDGERLQFLNIPKVVEELSFIRFRIEDSSRAVSPPCLAWACIRLDRLQRGYRFIRLMDMKGHPVSGGKLLVKIVKTLR